MVDVESTKSRGRISLCVIAKNEEGFIGDCLASVGGLCDELVVVDTGSTDRTVEIAESHGAIIKYFEWIDDFAAARNVALDASSGDWVLILDCDERIVRETIPALLEAIDKGDFDCGMVPFYSSARLDASVSDILSGEALIDEPSLLPRLFRRTSDLRWEGIVHEAPVEYLSKPDLRSLVLPTAVIHYGDVPSIREGLQKLERNKKLLERRIDEEPLDLVAWVYLGEERYRSGEIGASREAFDIAWELFEDQWMVHCTGVGTQRISKMLLRTFIEKASIARMLIDVQANRFEDALATARRCDQWNVDNPTLEYLSAVCFERFALVARNPARRKEWLHAGVEKLKSCLQARKILRSIAPLEGMTTWRAANKLGEIFIQLGEYSRAGEMFEMALVLRKDFLEPQIGLAEVALEQGRTQDAIRALQPLMDNECADIPLLISAALRKEGRWNEGEVYFDQAYKRVRQSVMAAYRATRINEMIKERPPVLVS